MWPEVPETDGKLQFLGFTLASQTDALWAGGPCNPILTLWTGGEHSSQPCARNEYKDGLRVRVWVLRGPSAFETQVVSYGLCSNAIE